MEWNNYLRCALKGILVSLAFTILATAILSLIMNFATLSDSAFNVIYVIISCIALVIGSFVAARSHGSKGWIVGIAVGSLYYFSLCILAIICGAEIVISIYLFMRIILAIAIGALAGMLAMNM